MYHLLNAVETSIQRFEFLPLVLSVFVEKACMLLIEQSSFVVKKKKYEDVQANLKMNALS
jgi:hypothetical protein